MLDFEKYETVDLDSESGELLILDQTLLPGECRMLRLRNQSDIREAIEKLRVRGAPAIGVSAAIGLYLASLDIEANNGDELLPPLAEAAEYLAASRPTAVNLTWALKRMLKRAYSARRLTVDRIREALRLEALAIRDEDIASCRAIGEFGLSLLHDGDGLLTHCNAGRLATVKYGTATAPMYIGQEKGYKFRIYCDETRPLLQGARLTAFELAMSGMDVTLLCDNMSSSLMRTGKINAVLVGCDRVAANGDTANKIGTSLLAIAAKHYNVPFYVCAPTSTVDMSCPTGSDIKIEQRKPTEVTEMWYEKRMAPEGIGVYNPAFDVTDASLITAFITNKGIVYPPFDKGLAALFDKNESEKKS